MDREEVTPTLPVEMEWDGPDVDPDEEGHSSSDQELEDAPPRELHRSYAGKAPSTKRSRADLAWSDHAAPETQDFDLSVLLAGLPLLEQKKLCQSYATYLGAKLRATKK